MTWDPKTEQLNRQRELSIAAALLRETEETIDLDVIRRLTRAAVMHLEQLQPAADATA